MITRRALTLTGLAAFAVSPFALAAPPGDPVAIINAIYARAAKGKGDVGPVDFDPVTNSQEPDVKSFSVAAEKRAADKAVVAVTIAGHGAAREKAADNTIRYNFVRDGGEWKIDDISGASDGEPWSIRGMLADSLKS